jgi:hypothetical protein
VYILPSRVEGEVGDATHDKVVGVDIVVGDVCVPSKQDMTSEADEATNNVASPIGDDILTTSIGERLVACIHFAAHRAGEMG